METRESIPPNTSLLLRFPWDILRQIILTVISHNGREAPEPSPRFIENRMTARNQFNPQLPVDTSLLFPAKTVAPIHGGYGLLGTNHRLRENTLQVLEQMARKEVSDGRFVLDVMVLPFSGVFPTWLSFPHTPRRMKWLDIKVRLLEPEPILRRHLVHATLTRQHRNNLYQTVLTALLLYSTGLVMLPSVQTLPYQSFHDRERADERPSATLVEPPNREPVCVIDEIRIDWNSFTCSRNPGDFCSMACKVFLPSLASETSISCAALPCYIVRVVDTLMKPGRRSHLPVHQTALAQSIGRIWSDDVNGGTAEMYLGNDPWTGWAWLFTMEEWFPADGDVAAALTRARGEVPQDDEKIMGLEYVQKRTEMGWWSPGCEEHIRRRRQIFRLGALTDE